jgi:hypothetical protein
MALQFLERARKINPREPALPRRIAETRLQAQEWKRTIDGQRRPPVTKP